MNGDLGVHSVPGKGSKFWIELDCSYSAQKNKNEKNPPEIGLEIESVNSDKYQEVVLYIDDNSSNIRLVERLLSKRKNILLLSAHEPETGIELAQVSNPKLILLDIAMPGMDGYQVLQELQKSTTFKNTPIIAVTANAMEKDIEQGLKAGFEAYLTKPINVPEFYTVIDNYIKH